MMKMQSLVAGIAASLFFGLASVAGAGSMRSGFSHSGAGFGMRHSFSGNRGFWHANSAWHGNPGPWHGHSAWNHHFHGFHGHHNRVFVGLGFYPFYGYPYYDYGYPYYGYYDYGYPAPYYGDPYYGIDDATAAKVQSALARRGYYHGEIDGVVGPASRRAIRDFQTDQGLQATGTVNAALLKALRIG